MPTLIKVICSNCGSDFSVSLKRFNESNKRKWKFFCSTPCRNSSKLTGKIIKCDNPACKKTFYRAANEINATGNYCSSNCSAIISNPKRKGQKYSITYKGPTTTEKVLKISKLVLHTKKCLNPQCTNLIAESRKFCSNACQWKYSSPGIEEIKVKVISEIKNFVFIHRRIPVKRECYGIYKGARVAFGTWNNAIKAAGFDPNPVLFAKKYMAKDGHKCDSLAEKIIDDWLFSHKVNHQIHVPYPGQKHLTADFVVGDRWIEFFRAE